MRSLGRRIAQGLRAAGAGGLAALVLAAPGAAEEPPTGLLALKTVVQPAEAALGDTVTVVCTLTNVHPDKTFDVLPLDLDIWSCFLRVEWEVPQPRPPSEPGKPAKDPPPPKIEGYNVIRYVPRFGQLSPLARRPLKPGESLTSRIPMICLRAGPQTVEAQYNGYHPSPQGTLRGEAAKLVVKGAGPLVAHVETTAGALDVELLVDKAPGTVANFATLVKQGFYDGTPIHRLLPDAYLQGGAPKGDPAGGPGWTIPYEGNDVKQEPGVWAMARGPGLHTAGSQFYACLAALPQLENGAGLPCVAFGRVTRGMDVLKALAKTPVEAREADAGGAVRWHPVTPLVVQKITLEAR